MNREHTRAVYRIVDASANRAFEGLRTLEEFARFVLDDGALAEPVKSLRHELASALALLSRKELLQARDTAGDVGTLIKTASEYTRLGTADVVAAAAARVQQSLRSLEEYGKLLSIDFATRVESIRYRCYDVFAKLELRGLDENLRRKRIQRSRLYVLSDAADNEAAFRIRLSQCVEGGVDVVQLRDRSCCDRVLLERARVATAVLKSTEVLFIVNDRADIAVAAGADGVHIGQDELTVEAVRQLVGDEMLVGVSTHSLAQAKQATHDGADYIGVGPCFPSQTKSFDDFVSTELLAGVSREVSIPAFAIGGITVQNLQQVLATGIQRVAVSAAVWVATDAQAAAWQLKTLLDGPHAARS